MKLLLLLTLWRQLNAFNLDINNNLKTLGEEKLKELRQNAAHDSCWAKAVSKLNATCVSLGDDEQRRLALAFANCHLKESGRPAYPCPEEARTKDCASRMSGEAFSAYTEFFTHTGHICHFLQSELWQRRAESTIAQLSETSSAAVEKLEVALEYHRELEAKQDSTLRMQGEILEQDRQIALSLRETGGNLTAIIGDVAEKAEKQKALLDDTLRTVQGSVDAVRYVMSLMLVEVVGVESLVLLVLALGVVMLLPQYGHSRAKLFIVLFGEVCLEVVTGKVVLMVDTSSQGMITLHWLQWWCRYAGSAASAFVYVREWWIYVDQSNHNAQLLGDIHSWVKQQQQQQQQQFQQSQHQHWPSQQEGCGLVCSSCHSPVHAGGLLEFQKNASLHEAYFRSLENVTSLVLPMSPPPDPVHTTPPDNSRSTSNLTPTWDASKQKRDRSTTPTRRLRAVAQGEKCGDIGAEQEKEVLEEKEVKEERWHCDDNRSRSPSPGRSRRAPLVITSAQPRYNLRSRTPAMEVQN
eukprot:Em0006g494a